jgi:glycine/D-amino acid oxidase-like deaminating enzyme
MGTAGEHWTLDDSTIHPNISNHLKNTTPETFYGREVWGDNGEVVEEWTGIMGYTVDKQPIVGEAPGEKGLWICAGFNGHGKHLT